MAITQALCNQAKVDFLGGVHQPGDAYMIALYTSIASLDKNTTAYTATGEVANGSGYVSGGMALSGYSRSLSGDTGYISFSGATWSPASITARGALIYNATRANAAIAVVDFGADFTSANGSFIVSMPAAGANAVIVIS